MSPEYLHQLADLADPDELWRRGGLNNRALMPEKQRQQLDTGVALRRYARHIDDLRRALSGQCSLLITPLSLSGAATLFVEIPEKHRRLIDIKPMTVPRGIPD